MGVLINYIENPIIFSPYKGALNYELPWAALASSLARGILGYAYSEFEIVQFIHGYARGVLEQS
jgi:hypothetical protein